MSQNRETSWEAVLIDRDLDWEAKKGLGRAKLAEIAGDTVGVFLEWHSGRGSPSAGQETPNKSG